MLARLVFLLVALPALALAADAGGGGRLKFAAQPSPAPATVQSAATIPVITPPTPAATPVVEPAECRMGCAQTFYFCHAGEHPDDCAGTWGQCVASCNSPNLAPGYSTAP